MASTLFISTEIVLFVPLTERVGLYQHFDAMGFEKTPICSAVGGPKDFISDSGTGSCVNGVYSVCDSVDSAFPELFTGREDWFVPCEHEIKACMRHYYTDRDKVGGAAGLTQADKFSYETLATRLKNI